MTGFAAVVLAGGAARRMGGVDKPARPVGGRPMRDRVLAAVADADPRILVGPAGDAPADVLVTRERPPGGGPVAAAAAGLALLGPGTHTVALLAADLPLLTRAAVDDLRHRLEVGTDTAARHPATDIAAQQPGTEIGARHPGRDAAARQPGRDIAAGPDGVCYVDDDGRRQPLCGVWRVASLRVALDRLAAQRGGTLDGASIRALLAGLTVLEVPWAGSGPPPWFDCDTDEDVRRAEEWTR